MRVDSATLTAHGKGTYTFRSTGVTVEVPPMTLNQAYEIWDWFADYQERGRYGAVKKIMDWFRANVSTTALDGLSPPEMLEEVVRFFSEARTGAGDEPAGGHGASRSGSASTSSRSSTSVPSAVSPTPPGAGGPS